MALTPNACPSGDSNVALFGLLLETNARLSKELGSVLDEACELPLAWFEVLLQLRQSPEGRLKMSQMADAIVHSTGGTTRLVDRLEEAGLVRREHCPNDRRAIYIGLTGAGDTKLNEALTVHLHYLDHHVAARLTVTERESLTTLLTKLNALR